MVCRDDYGNLPLEVATYLHSKGVVQNPNAPMDEYSSTPGVYVDGMWDTPEAAVSISTLADLRDDQENPLVTLSIAMRHPTMGGVLDLAQRVFEHLHDHTHYPLTANTHVLHSQRALKAKALRDANDRLLRVDTYQFRLLVREET